MRVKASAGRTAYLTDTFCQSLTLKADHPDDDSLVMEQEFLARLYTELAANNVGYWLSRLRKAQKATKAKGS